MLSLLSDKLGNCGEPRESVREEREEGEEREQEENKFLACWLQNIMRTC